MNEKLAIVGGGAIATGLATIACTHEPVTICVRSEQSAERTRALVDKTCARHKPEPIDPTQITVTTDLAAVGDATAVVEAIAEELEHKVELWGRLAPLVAADALLGSTTSSLSVQAIADASGAPERFVGLHVFNPVTQMKLVELAYPAQATADTRARAHTLCEALEKEPVEVPDTPGFVVNRLLFPYLFSAVDFQAESGLESEAIDTCMKLGAGHPMGPLALLDYVGLDVSKAIGEAIGVRVPPRIEQLVAEGALGRKSGRGFYDYS